jgi:5-methyltetrahydrofolate--homocysteine methyltransferase
MIDLSAIKDNVIKGEVDEVRDLVKEAVDAGQDVKKILNEGLIAGINAVGSKYESGEFFLPEMVIAATAMKEGLAILNPLLQQTDTQSAGKIILGSAKGDIHDIGKNIVATMLEGSGFMVKDVGVDVDPETFVTEAKDTNADIIGISALLTTTMGGMEDVIKAVKEAGLKIKVIVGGSSVTQAFADQIKADGYASDAVSAVAKCRELVRR